MSYRLLLMALALGGLTLPARLIAAEPLPPGAVARLGDSRFRAGGPVERLEFSADGKHLTAYTPDRLRTAWDTVAWEPVRTRVDVVQIGAIVRWQSTVIPDTSLGVIVNAEGVAVVRDFAAKKDLARLTGHFARVTAVTVSPDGKRIATGRRTG